MQAVDGKKLLIDFLKVALNIPVFPKRPDGQMPEAFVVVIDVGGKGRVNRLKVESGFLVDTYAKTDGSAEKLALEIDEAIHSLPIRAEPICSVSGSLPRENPDDDAPRHARRSANYILTSRLLKGS